MRHAKPIPHVPLDRGGCQTLGIYALGQVLQQLLAVIFPTPGCYSPGTPRPWEVSKEFGEIRLVEREHATVLPRLTSHTGLAWATLLQDQLRIPKVAAPAVELVGGDDRVLLQVARLAGRSCASHPLTHLTIMAVVSRVGTLPHLADSLGGANHEGRQLGQPPGRGRLRYVRKGALLHEKNAPGDVEAEVHYLIGLVVARRQIQRDEQREAGRELVRVDTVADR
mmetsp:Transcript_11006/g.23144  ORF Transcript_11006/g.23144 Transcript_11006/m.23144 type:complete len:224 (+) Transcript_11006:351-1022(+)